MEVLKELTVEVNRERKNMQVMSPKTISWSFTESFGMQDRFGNQLDALEKRWTELISSVLQIEMANVALEIEVDRLNKRADELEAPL